MRRVIGLALGIVLLSIFFSTSSFAAPFQEKHWMEQMGVGVQVLIGAVALLTALIGVPVAWMKIQETRATIRKLNLEAEQMERQAEAGSAESVGSIDRTAVVIDGNHNYVSVMTDPRFAGPLLIIIDFVIACIILMLLSYGLSMLPSGYSFSLLSDFLKIGVGFGLLYPIVQDAYKIRKTLKSQISEAEEATSKSGVGT